MSRSTFFALPLSLAALAAMPMAGCAKSDGAVPHAEMPIGDVKLASAGMPGPDMTYVADQASIKLVNAPTVSYEPLETFRTATPAGEATAEGGAEAAGGGTSGGGGVKAALTALAGKLMGGGEPGPGRPGVPGKGPRDGEDSAVKLVDMKDALNELPEHPSKLTGEPVDTAKAAAMTLAKEHLAKRLFTMKLNDEKTIGEAIGADADPKKMEFASAIMVGATWLNPNKLEVEIMCKVSDIATELESKFSSLDLTVVKAMAQDKALAAKGTGELKHEKGGTRHAKPGEMSRQAGEEGGGGGI